MIFQDTKDLSPPGSKLRDHGLYCAAADNRIVIDPIVLVGFVQPVNRGIVSDLNILDGPKRFFFQA